MAGYQSHLQLASRNQRALDALIDSGDTLHPEWVATIAFYKAVQLTEAFYNRKNGRNCNGHTHRGVMLKSIVCPVYKHYSALYRASTVARYLVDLGSPDIAAKKANDYSTFSAYMSCNVVDELVKNRLVNFEGWVVSQCPDFRDDLIRATF